MSLCSTHASHYRSGYALRAGHAAQRSGGARKTRRVVVLVLILVLATTGTAWAWTINDITVDGATYVPNATIRDVALETLSERRWGVIPRRSVMFGGMRSTLREVLHKQFVLDDIHFSRSGSTLSIRVVEPSLAAVLFTAGGGSAFVTGDGSLVQQRTDRAREEILASEQAKNLLVLSWAVPLETVGPKPLDAERLASLRLLWTVLQSEGGPALAPSFAAPKYGNAGDFDVTTASGASVSLTTQEPAERQAEKLRAVLRDRAKPEQRAAIRSIDLRYGDRVYIQ